MNASNMVAAAIIDKENEIKILMDQMEEKDDRLKERDLEVEKLSHQIVYKEQEI